MQNEEPSPVEPAAGLRNATETLEIPAGDWVYRLNEAGAELFIIEAGEVDLVDAGSGEDHVAARLGPGEFFGEASACGETLRGESARAHSDCRLLPIHRDLLPDLVRAEPGIALAMIDRLRRRIDDLRAAAIEPAAAEPTPEPPASATEPRATLVDVESGRRFELVSGEETSLGRAGGAVEPDIDLSDIDPHATVSRSHAVILTGTGGIRVIERKPSTNGTFVDGERISAGVEVSLSHGCRLMIGSVEMTLEVG